jgi:hypothetical protein
MSEELKTVTGPEGSLVTLSNRMDQQEQKSDAEDARLDSLCTQVDTINQEVRDLRSALDIPALTGVGVGLDLSSVNLPDYNPAACQG